MTNRAGLVIVVLVVLVVVVASLAAFLVSRTTQAALPTLFPTPTITSSPIEPSPQDAAQGQYLTATSAAQATFVAQKTQIAATELAGFADRQATITILNQEASIARTKRANAYTETAQAQRSPTPKK